MELVTPILEVKQIQINYLCIDIMAVLRIRWFILCVYTAKINQTLPLVIHHQSFLPVSIRQTLSIISGHAENTLRYLKDNISAGVCHHKAWMLVSGKTLSTNSVKTKSVFENIISPRMAGCYMLGEENRHCIAFMLWEGSARERLYPWACVCVWRVMGEHAQTGTRDIPSPAATRGLDLPHNGDQTHTFFYVRSR